MITPDFTIIECEQRSPDWVNARLGRVTGTRAVDMLAKIKTGEAAGRRNLRIALSLERVTGQSMERSFSTADTEHGVTYEPVALSTYEIKTGCIVNTTGFLSCNALMAGCSLDGHVNDFEGIVEIKCPNPATHFEYVRERKIPSDYARQCLHNLWVTGAKWCDFVSYSPHFPDKMQFLCVRMPRVEADIDWYDGEIRRFLAEVAIDTREIMERAA